jgi:ElaA protein
MSIPPDWKWHAFHDLSATMLHAVLRARAEVFVVEQHCPFVDPDAMDMHAQHLLGWSAESGGAVLAAYLRLIAPGFKYAEPSIGRVLTTTPFRGRGFGRPLMQEGLRKLREAFPGHACRIGAQQHLEKFYASLGFRTVSAPYIEDGIAHVEMLIAPGAR